MKKNIFIILVSTLLILVLIYLYNQVEITINKKFINNKIHIEYPYFNNEPIDNYINQYLNNYTEKNHNLIFIDYDYEENNQNINLNLYIYEEFQNVIKQKEKTFKINLLQEKIEPITNLKGKKINQTIKQNNKDKNKKLIALTFDDGPNQNTIKVLNILEKYNAKATFFILGCNIKGNEKIITRMKNLNMEIGNHMYSHKLLNKLTNEEIKEEYTKVDNLIFEITKNYPTLIRPSYGTYNDRIKKLLDRPIIIWNIDTLDWKYHNSKRIYKKVLKEANDGDIILMHDIYNATANSLELIIPELIEKDYQFVTVTELLSKKGINIEKGHVYSSAK